MSDKKKTILITGATGAVGSVITRECLYHNFRIILVVRNQEKAHIMFPGDDVTILYSDFNNKTSVMSVAEEINLNYSLDAIINCASGGISSKRVISEDKIDQSFLITYLSMYIFNKIIIDHQISKGLSGAFIMTVPERNKIDFDNLQAERKYSPLDRWHQLNIMKNTLWSYWAEKYQDTGLSVIMYSPGFIRHENRFYFPGIMKLPIGLMELLAAGDGKKGAKQLISYLLSSSLKNYNGNLLNIDKVMPVPKHYTNKSIQDRLINETEKLLL